MYGEKIIALNLAVCNFSAGLKRMPLTARPDAAAVTFGGSPCLYPSLLEINPIDFQAGGTGRLTEALWLAKTVIVQKTAVLLISDGSPDDGGYLRALRNMPFVTGAFAIAIGYDADMDMLERFTGDKARIIPASDALGAAEYILKTAE